MNWAIWYLLFIVLFASYYQRRRRMRQILHKHMMNKAVYFGDMIDTDDDKLRNRIGYCSSANFFPMRKTLTRQDLL